MYTLKIKGLFSKYFRYYYISFIFKCVKAFYILLSGTMGLRHTPHTIIYTSNDFIEQTIVNEHRLMATTVEIRPTTVYFFKYCNFSLR